MAKCPNCGAEIDHVKMYVAEENRYEVSLEGEALDWSTSEVVLGSERSMMAECPECDAELFMHEGETGGETFMENIRDFLRGKKYEEIEQ